MSNSIIGKPSEQTEKLIESIFNKDKQDGKQDAAKQKAEQKRKLDEMIELD